MKATQITRTGSLFSLTMLFVIAIGITGVKAQDKPSAGKGQQKNTTIQMKITTTDEEGKTTTLDTVIQTNVPDPSDLKKMVKSLERRSPGEKEKDRKIIIDLEMDSLPENEASIRLMVEDKLAGYEELMKDLDFNLQELENLELPEPEHFRFEIDRDAMKDVQRAMERFRDVHGDWYPDHSGPWSDGYTPWGQISEIRVKDKKRGKKIVIRTADDSFPFSFTPPRPPMPPKPPLPPKPPKKVKKIIIGKDKP